MRLSVCRSGHRAAAPAGWVLALCVLGATPAAAPLYAQSNRLLPVDDPATELVQRLQRRGHLLELHPTALPYREGDVARALAALDPRALDATERHWLRLLRRLVPPPPRRRARARRQPAPMRFGGELDAGLRVADSDRLDPLRPLDAGTSTLRAGRARLFPRAGTRLYLDGGPVVAEMGLRFDVFYDTDPDGLDAANRLYVRSEHSYAGARHRLAEVYLGRFDQHWGRLADEAVLVSANPRSYDVVAFRFGGQRLSVQSLLGELDSSTLDGRFTGRVGGDWRADNGGDRRYLAAHRFDWRPSRFVNLSILEATLYSGPNSGPSLKYLNPLHGHFFVSDNTPKNDENNGFIAGLLWAQYRAWSLHGQLLLDDFDLLNRNEPAAVSLVGSLRYAGLAAADLGAGLALATARAYNTTQPEGRYIYLLRGLAMQFNDFVHAHAEADLYLDRLTPGLRLSPQVHLLWQGETDIRQDFPPDQGVPVILSGTVERTLRLGAHLRYQGSPRWWLGLDYGVNLTHNDRHRADVQRVRGVGLATFGLRLRGRTPVRTDF